jgi:hypothetical protein
MTNWNTNKKVIMNLERLVSDKTVAYVPQFAGERSKAAKDPEYRPVIFHLAPMTVTQFEEAGDLLREEERGNGEVRFRLRPELEEKILQAHVKRIENLSFSDGSGVGDGAAFALARKTASAAVAPLYLEVLAAVRDISVLREGERKN